MVEFQLMNNTWPTPQRCGAGSRVKVRLRNVAQFGSLKNPAPKRFGVWKKTRLSNVSESGSLLVENSKLSKI